MSKVSANRWVKFLRSYGPIPANDNMYDEAIHRALKKNKIAPLKLPVPYLRELVENFKGEEPLSQILTGTAGDGKTYLCRELWVRLGGDEDRWLNAAKNGEHQLTLELDGYELVFVKDLSEMAATESVSLLREMASAVQKSPPKRCYLIAANHGQLLEKLKEASPDSGVERLLSVVEEQLHSGENPHPEMRVKLINLSRNPDAGLVGDIIDQIVKHEGWNECDGCPVRSSGEVCPIWENKERLSGVRDHGTLRTRLTALVQISILNDQHFPIRQLLSVVANAILGHPNVRDKLMSCQDVPGLVESDQASRASIYGNLFGSNLSSRKAEKTEAFRKLNLFGVGGETSNAADNLLVYGADDPELKDSFEELVLCDEVYGGTPGYLRAQQDYLENFDPKARSEFLDLLRGQRQRLFFTLPEKHEEDFELWDLTVFRYAGLYLKLFTEVHHGKPIDRKVMALLVRGLNRLFTGMLIQNENDLILATSGSLSQSNRSPLLDTIISVPRRLGEEVSLVPVSLPSKKVAVRIKFGRTNDPEPEELVLTPTRFEFICRVADGALPNSFSLECQEDLLAFKARLLAATQRRREIDEEDEAQEGEIVFNFIKVGTEGTAESRRVVVKD